MPNGIKTQKALFPQSFYPLPKGHQNQETKRDGESHPCIQLLETRFVLGLFSFQKKEPDFSVCCLSSLPPPFCTGLVLFIENRIARHTENAKHLMYGNPRFFGCAKEKSKNPLIGGFPLFSSLFLHYKKGISPFFQIFHPEYRIHHVVEPVLAVDHELADGPFRMVGSLGHRQKKSPECGGVRP